MTSTTTHQNQWWTNFFPGLMTDVQIKMSNPEQTRIEATFLKDVFNLSVGAIVADVPCGDGRLSVALSKLGYEVRGVDISPEIIEAANKAAKSEGVTSVFSVGDMKAIPWVSELDGAFCFGNSFSYFDDEGNRKFLKAIAQALKPGGRFIIQSNLIAESILTKPLSRTWYTFGETLFLHSASYDSGSATLTSEYTLLRKGESEIKRAHYRIYLLRELISMLEASGFRPLQVLGSLKKEEFKLGDPSVYVLAEKIT